MKVLVMWISKPLEHLENLSPEIQSEDGMKR